jgi:uncharacterized protein
MFLDPQWMLRNLKNVVQSGNMKKIAVIGSGISGLSAAYLLSSRHEVSLLEQDSRIGGHTHTHTIETTAGPLPIDSGFIVHNDQTYPNFIRLMAKLGVVRINSHMSFSVKDSATGLEWSSKGLNGFFADRSRLFSPSHFRLLADVMRFNRTAAKALENGEAELPLGEYMDRHNYSREFRDYYLYPTASAIWSTAPARILEFPAMTLIRFFRNHGLLGVDSHHQWRTLRGGCSSYIPHLLAPLGNRVYLNSGVQAIHREEKHVRVVVANGRQLEFDEVVLATHGDVALRLLAQPTPNETAVLSAFQTSLNDAVLHTDESLLPKRRSAWAAWNYNLNLKGNTAPTLSYHMNLLQSLPTRENYCVTLNATEAIRPDRILRRMQYRHPLYTLEAVRSQQRWDEISGRDRVHFCGAYWRYGFHEDGLVSAMRVARTLGVALDIAAEAA